MTHDPAHRSNACRPPEGDLAASRFPPRVRFPPGLPHRPGPRDPPGAATGRHGICGRFGGVDRAPRDRSTRPEHHQPAGRSQGHRLERLAPEGESTELRADRRRTRSPNHGRASSACRSTSIPPRVDRTDRCTSPPSVRHSPELFTPPHPGACSCPSTDECRTGSDSQSFWQTI
jgi:hypothetical protein